MKKIFVFATLFITTACDDNKQYEEFIQQKTIIMTGCKTAKWQSYYGNRFHVTWMAEGCDRKFCCSINEDFSECKLCPVQ